VPRSRTLGVSLTGMPEDLAGKRNPKRERF
jgi:hypothetical protein